MGPLHGNHCRKVVAIRRWSLAQVWLYFENCFQVSVRYPLLFDRWTRGYRSRSRSRRCRRWSDARRTVSRRRSPLTILRGRKRSRPEVTSSSSRPSTSAWTRSASCWKRKRSLRERIWRLRKNLTFSKNDKFDVWETSKFRYNIYLIVYFYIWNVSW